MTQYTWDNLDVPIRYVDKLELSIDSYFPSITTPQEVKDKIQTLKTLDPNFRLSIRWDLAGSTALRPIDPNFKFDWLQWIPIESWLNDVRAWLMAGYKFQWATVPWKTLEPIWFSTLFKEASVRFGLPGLYARVNLADKIIEPYLFATAPSDDYATFIIDKVTSFAEEVQVNNLVWGSKSGFWRPPQRIKVVPDMIIKDGDGGALHDTPFKENEWEVFNVSILDRLTNLGFNVFTRDHPSRDHDPRGNDVPWQWLKDYPDLLNKLKGEVD